MRIYFWLAAGVGAMAIGTAAAARPGGTSSGHGGNPPGTWSSGGHHGGNYARRGLGPGVSKGDHGRRHGRFGRHGRDRSNAYGGGGVVGPVVAVDPYGNGFFNGGGGEIRLRGGRPHYDYDRAYPYQWASAAGERLEEERVRTVERPPRCTFENGVRVCRGW